MLGTSFIQNFIKNPIGSLDHNKYILYNDGTDYYKTKEGTIYRITSCNILLISSKTGEWTSIYPSIRSIYGPCMYSN